MSIKNYVRIVNRFDQTVVDLKVKYSHQSTVLEELDKLHRELLQLIGYLNQLDHLQPHYNTDEVNGYLRGINLHLDILKAELETKDYSLLQNGMRVIKVIFKFHPTKHSFLTFIIAWIGEWLYFI